MNQNALTLAIDQVMPLAVATGLFTSLCSIGAPTPASGAPDGTYAAVGGLQDIPCMDAPDNFGNALSASEIKTAAQTESMARRHVLLNAYYPELSPATNWGAIGWRASVDGVAYDLIGAEADSQRTQTRLCLRKVTT